MVYKENYEKKKELADGYMQTIVDHEYMMDELEKYAAKKAELQPEIDALSEKMISSADKTAPKLREQLQAELDVYKENYEKKKELADGYMQTIVDHEYMMEELEKGTAESQKNIIDYVENTYKENGKSCSYPRRNRSKRSKVTSKRIRIVKMR